MRLINAFSKEILNKIGYYVYSDSNTRQLFYVSKGKGILQVHMEELRLQP